MSEHLKTAKQTILEALQASSWWDHVQVDVRRQIGEIVRQLELVGAAFRDAYVAAFRFNHLCRVHSGKSAPPMLSPLLSALITEEAYQSAIEPTRSLLELDDWFEPNDADVKACMLLCQQIEVLISLDVLERMPEIKGLNFFHTK